MFVYSFPKQQALLALLGVALFFTTLFISTYVHSASCCGGGAGSGIILPKFQQHMLDFNISNEQYDGFWTQKSQYRNDPANSDLSQQRLNMAYAYRLSEQWQLGVSSPLVYNQNRYSGVESNVFALGDSQVNLWYEAFERVTCVYKITGWKSLQPSLYFGTALTLPTGISQYSDRIDSSFDITGRGFYRLDGQVLIEKTIYPWSASIHYIYGQYLKRPVNQEYGQAIEPYNKQLGDRQQLTLSAGYTWFLANFSMLSFTLNHNTVDEDNASINSIKDSSSGFENTSFGFALAYSKITRDWVIKTSFTQLDTGRNTPKTQTLSIGASHVF